MPKTKASSDEEVVNHYGGIRLRITGAGDLKLKLFSHSEVKQTTLLPLSILSRTNIQPTRLSNFTQQKAKLEIRTTEIDEVFNISKIVVFVKPVAKSYPG